jgi:hypothetical protein
VSCSSFLFFSFFSLSLSLGAGGLLEDRRWEMGEEEEGKRSYLGLVLLRFWGFFWVTEVPAWVVWR